MKSLEIIGFKRANLGKASSRDMRREAMVPCVLYGNKMENLFFSVPMILFRELVYTANVYQVDLNIEGTHYKAILQDVQFHPVNELILHADFLLLQEDKAIKMDIPVKITGASVGVQQGGKLLVKVKTLPVKALPKDMPDYITVDVTKLEVGKSIRVEDLTTTNYEIATAGNVTIATVAVTRALKQAASGK
jgi:large subunit ribosomal protein L25